MREIEAMKKTIKTSALWILFAGILAGCGGSDSETTDAPATQNSPDHHSYVFRSPYYVTTHDINSTPVKEFDMQALQDYIDNAWEKSGEDAIFDYMDKDVRAKIDWIEAPLVMTNGYDDTIVHTRPGEVLTNDDVKELKSVFLTQFADGWGSNIADMYFEISPAKEELYVCLYGAPNWSIDLFGDYSYETDPASGDVLITPLLP